MTKNKTGVDSSRQLKTGPVRAIRQSYETTTATTATTETDRQADTDGRTDWQRDTDGRTDTDRRTDTDGRTDRQADGRNDIRIDRQTYFKLSGPTFENVVHDHSIFLFTGDGVQRQTRGHGHVTHHFRHRVA